MAPPAASGSRRRRLEREDGAYNYFDETHELLAIRVSLVIL
jgi:hypothetical protein